MWSGCIYFGTIKGAFQVALIRSLLRFYLSMPGSILGCQARIPGRICLSTLDDLKKFFYHFEIQQIFQKQRAVKLQDVLVYANSIYDIMVCFHLLKLRKFGNLSISDHFWQINLNVLGCSFRGAAFKCKQLYEMVENFAQSLLMSVNKQMVHFNLRNLRLEGKRQTIPQKNQQQVKNCSIFRIRYILDLHLSQLLQFLKH
eukprot:TRINITY_DN184_c0_g1_i9.p3 TRINITY_DN184_c0_g1~~TRINITY_DN184_c0_g1_i9.p3  ORF type:complete len:200 (-),score=-3.25 TRINITY_DN184_c0_g1_i9:278-877(-)